MPKKSITNKVSRPTYGKAYTTSKVAYLLLNSIEGHFLPQSATKIL